MPTKALKLQTAHDLLLAQHSHLRMEVLAVSPDMARELLTRVGIQNRSISPTVVANYARLMRDGLWRLNGESFIFDEEGNLLNGQHRLHAVILANCTISFTVIYGIDKTTFDTIDGPRRRLFSHRLGIENEKDPNTLSAAVRLLFYYEQGPFLKKGNIQPSQHELQIVLDEHPNIRRSVPFANRCKRLIPPSLATVLHYLFATKQPDLADQFFTQLASGENLSSDQPVYLLRRQLFDNVGRARRMPPIMVAALTVKTWNAMRTQKRLLNLTFRISGEFPEEFPRII